MIVSGGRCGLESRVVCGVGCGCAKRCTSAATCYGRALANAELHTSASLVERDQTFSLPSRASRAERKQKKRGRCVVHRHRPLCGWIFKLFVPPPRKRECKRQATPPAGGKSAWKIELMTRGSQENDKAQNALPSTRARTSIRLPADVEIEAGLCEL